MLLLMMMMLLVATSYQDSQNRFSIILADGWEQLPAAASTTGGDDGQSMVFRRRDDKLLATALVYVMDAGGTTTLDEVAHRSARTLRSTPGYRLLEEGDCRLGGGKAFRRRYLTSVGDDENKWQKMSEDRWTKAFGRVYLVHVESLAESFGSFSRDYDTLFAGFRPISADVGNLLDSPVVGRWLMVGDASNVLDLRADGTFDFASMHGTYVVQGAVLIMRSFGAEPERFSWRCQGDTLALSAENLAEPIVYRRDARNHAEKNRAKPAHP